jgi:hypothetical protein
MYKKYSLVPALMFIIHIYFRLHLNKMIIRGREARNEVNIALLAWIFQVK